MKKNLMGALALLGVVSLVVGCTALSGGKDSDVVITSVRRPELQVEQDIKPPQPAEEFMDDKKKGSGKFEITGRRLNPPDLPWPDVKAAKKDDCCCSATKKAAPKPTVSPAAKQACPALTVASASVATPVTPIPVVVTPAPRFTLGKPLAPYQTSSVGDRVELKYKDGWFTRFAFFWWSTDKRVYMTQQKTTHRFECGAFSVDLDLLTNPSRRWEIEFDRSVAIHATTGGMNNAREAVDPTDVIAGARAMLSGHTETICAFVAGLPENVVPGAAGIATEFNRYVKEDPGSLFDVVVISASIVKVRRL